MSAKAKKRLSPEQRKATKSKDRRAASTTSSLLLQKVSAEANIIMVTSAQGAKRYILQKINTDTFKDPDGLMENICGVTDFLREKAKQCGTDPARATLHVVLTKAGKPYYRATDGSCWRIYDFVENTVCLQQVQSAENFYQSAVAFGDFQH